MLLKRDDVMNKRVERSMLVVAGLPLGSQRQGQGVEWHWHQLVNYRSVGHALR